MKVPPHVIAAAAARQAVRVNSSGMTGRLLYVGRTTGRAKVRLVSGYHVSVPLADVEPVEEA